MGTELAVGSHKRVGAFEKRVHEVDLIRGILILIVLIDHILNCFLLHSLSWRDSTGNMFWQQFHDAMQWYWDCIPRQIIRQICLILFCFISGISCAFSRNNWKRACQMILVFAIIQVGSNLLQSWAWLGSTYTIIDFNVIGVLAFSTLFYCFIQNCSWKGLLASTLLWGLFVTYGMDIIRTIPGTLNARVPSLVEPLFQTGDWMPLVPYILFFFMGALFSYFVYQDKTSKVRRHEWERPFCFVGRHTIWIYLGHQAVFIPIFMLIDLFVRLAHGG